MSLCNYEYVFDNSFSLQSIEKLIGKMIFFKSILPTSIYLHLGVVLRITGDYEIGQQNAISFYSLMVKDPLSEADLYNHS